MKNQKTVLLAFTGGKKSTVAAYLLLKQGYKVTACSFLMGSLQSSCALNDMDKAQEICKILGINHFNLDLRSEFAERVISPLIASRLSGEDFYPCFNCNILKIENLLKKANEQKFDFIATGHIANLNREPSGLKLLQAKEIEFDQSFFLSGLRENLLEKLLLPLGKLSHFEINKISTSLNLGIKEIRVPTEKCLKDRDKIISIIEEQVPLSLRPEGLILEEETGLAFGQHNGIYNFRLGDKNPGNSDRGGDFSVVGFEINKNTVLIRENVTFIQDQFKVYMFDPFQDIDLSQPLNCHIAMENGNGKIPCKIYLGNNGFAVVNLEKQVDGPIEKGRLIVFYDVIDEVSRVIATACIYEVGQFIEDKKEEGNYIN